MRTATDLLPPMLSGSASVCLLFCLPLFEDVWRISSMAIRAEKMTCLLRSDDSEAPLAVRACYGSVIFACLWCPPYAPDLRGQFHFCHWFWWCHYGIIPRVVGWSELFLQSFNFVQLYWRIKTPARNRFALFLCVLTPMTYCITAAHTTFCHSLQICLPHY